MRQPDLLLRDHGTSAGSATAARAMPLRLALLFILALSLTMWFGIWTGVSWILSMAWPMVF